jgi:hypothetical protein
MPQNRSGLLEKRKSIAPAGIRKPDRSARVPKMTQHWRKRRNSEVTVRNSRFLLTRNLAVFASLKTASFNLAYVTMLSQQHKSYRVEWKGD